MTPEKCAAMHFGPWLIDLDWLSEAVALINDGILKPMAVEPEGEGDRPYTLDSAGVAILPVIGPMMKGQSKYGGTSTLDLRRKLRKARADSEVKAALLLIDSPGGTYAGTADLAAEVRALAAEKPTQAHIEDLGGSAAYWVAAQTHRITASPTAQVGSIGTVATLVDSSKAHEEAGIKVHVLSSGDYKGVGAEGVPVTDKQLDYLRGRVADLNSHFLAAVAAGRQVPMETVEGWADGRVWIADPRAKAMGLIDGLGTFEGAVGDLRAAADAAPPLRAEMAALRLRLTRLAYDLGARLKT